MAGRTPDFEPHDGLGPLASRYVDIDAIPWLEARPGLRMKVLFKDDEAKQATVLMEAEPGAVITEHIHTGVEQTLVLEGSLEDDEGVCAAGSFVWRPVGSRHAARTPNGAKFLVFFQNSARSVDTGRLFPSYGD